MEAKIITNNQWRNLRYGYEMPSKLRAEFDYIDATEFDSHEFIAYRGQWYDLGEFMRCNEMPGWDGCSADSYFSGVVVKFSRDGERVKVGTYLC